LLVDARRGYSPLAAWRSRGVCFILIFTSTGAPLLHFYCESARIETYMRAVTIRV
jgi:hypothetical protein